MVVLPGRLHTHKHCLFVASSQAVRGKASALQDKVEEVGFVSLLVDALAGFQLQNLRILGHLEQVSRLKVAILRLNKVELHQDCQQVFNILFCSLYFLLLLDTRQLRFAKLYMALLGHWLERVLIRVVAPAVLGWLDLQSGVAHSFLHSSAPGVIVHHLRGVVCDFNRLQLEVNPLVMRKFVCFDVVSELIFDCIDDCNLALKLLSLVADGLAKGVVSDLPCQLRPKDVAHWIN